MQLSKTASSPGRIRCSPQRWASEKITQQGGMKTAWLIGKNRKIFFPALKIFARMKIFRGSCFLWNLNWATEVPNLLQMTLQSNSSSQSSYVKGTRSLGKIIQKQLQSRILCVGTTGPCHCSFFSGVMAGLSFTYRNRKWRLMKLSQNKSNWYDR